MDGGGMLYRHWAIVMQALGNAGSWAFGIGEALRIPGSSS